VDDFRAINSITLRQPIRFSPCKRPEIFRDFLHYLTAVLFLRKLAALLGRP
jgi:hypothetical protein